jgi:hypothetical protein
MDCTQLQSILDPECIMFHYNKSYYLLTFKINLCKIEKTNFIEKNKKISAEDYTKFNRELKSFQRKLSISLSKIIKSNRTKNIEEILEPIANNYIKTFDLLI